MIEAETYRIGAHTSSDDPTKYRDDSELSSWIARDPITRLEAYLRDKGVEQAFFDEVAQEGADYSADIRHRIVAIENPDPASMFANVYSDPHPLMTEQAAWLANYEASFAEQESPSSNAPTPTPDANSVQEAAPTAEGGDA
jgi:pyruvate dehydrogenase E1 component alpha subunit